MISTQRRSGRWAGPCSRPPVGCPRASGCCVSASWGLRFGRLAYVVSTSSGGHSMVAAQSVAREARTDPSVDFEAVVIGAGVSGLYQLYWLRELGLKVRVFEAGTGVGGTWYWNRYPGARFDSESYTYGYSFSQELLEEWNWAERFAPQPETERYLNYVADKFDLRRDIQFKSRVAAAHYQEEMRSWEITLEDGRHYSTRFLVT